MKLKYITLFFIILFLLLLVGMAILHFIYPPNNVNEVNNNTKNLKYFTLNTVKNHSNKSDCYLVIKQNVYDVSYYIRLHPGGSRSITSRCGKEVTSIFASIHSNFAWDLLKNYKIGILQNEKVVNTNIDETLKFIENSIKSYYPNAEVLNIKPSKSGFVSKVISKNTLYELHIDKKGKITNVEVANDEQDWNNWSDDKDDR